MNANEEYEAAAYAARLAGEFADEIEAGKIKELEEKYGNESFRNRSYWRWAEIQHARIRNRPFEKIRDNLNKIRREKKAVAKSRSSVPEKRWRNP
jgi:hypothetical protein